MDNNKTSRPQPTGSAWQQAEQYGIDMSLIEANLKLTPYERMLQHDRSLNLALQLRQAMERQHG